MQPLQKADNHNRPYTQEELDEHLVLLRETMRDTGSKKRVKLAAKADSRIV